MKPRLPFTRSKDKPPKPLTNPGKQAKATTRHRDMKDETLFLLLRPLEWPLKIVLAMRHPERGDIGFVLSANPCDLVHGFVHAVPDDVLRSYNGDLSADVFERWIEEQRVEEYKSIQAMIDDGWIVD